jgi:Fe-S cluster biogenesis protein NfuA
MTLLIINPVETPNPNSMKFVIDGFKISSFEPTEFKKRVENKKYFSSLANDLLKKHYIESVFFGMDFISVNKIPDESWDRVTSDIIFTIMMHEDQIKDGSLISELAFPIGEEDEGVEFDAGDADIVEMIKEFLDDVIRPQIAMDGGDIELKAFKNGIAYLRLKGACSTCPSSTQTLYYGVREMLITNVPEVMDVEQV